MKQRLVILSGSEDSQIFDLEHIESFTLGRAVSNNLVLSGRGISRHHCLIKREQAGNFILEDLGSHNGTFVNDVPVQQLLLKQGDLIRIGSIQLQFLCGEDEKELNFSNEIQFVEDEAADTQSDIRLLPEKSVQNLSPDLNALAQIGRVLDDSKSFDELLQKLLQIILGFISAERAAVLLLNENAELPNTVIVLDKKKDENRLMRISRRITQRVLTEKTAILSNNVSQSDFQTAESLITYGISSVLCVPLLMDEITGLIYLDSTDSAFNFEQKHLQQMTATAAIVAAALKNARQNELLKIENEFLQKRAQIETNMIGESDAMKSLFHLISKVARSDSNVLISGETGTGKEMVALDIHKNSSRANKLPVIVNCAILNENLLESDLFGHEKGAFTGAVSQRKGKLELAEGSTLFLDEIGELSIHLQAKLLRFLQEREFERVGGTKVLKANVRIIAATNRNLIEEVDRKRFREDLFFRLNVVEIKTPALRDRKEDIPLLAQYFIGKYSEQCKRKVVGMSRKTHAALLNHEWRGNVRELQNAIERAIVLGFSDTIQIEDMPYEIIEKSVFEKISNLDLHALVKEAKSKIILSAVKDANKNYSEAARRLGIHPNNLHRILRELGIKEESKR